MLPFTPTAKILLNGLKLAIGVLVYFIPFLILSEAIGLLANFFYWTKIGWFATLIFNLLAFIRNISFAVGILAVLLILPILIITYDQRKTIADFFRVNHILKSIAQNLQTLATFFVLSVLAIFIAKEITCSGVGLHSGKKIEMTLLPQPANSGVRFETGNSSHRRIIDLNPKRVVATGLATTLGDSSCRVSTVEHLLAALWGLEIDNLLIRLEGEEIPIMDGSAFDFIVALHGFDIGVGKSPLEQIHLRGAHDGTLTLADELNALARALGTLIELAGQRFHGEHGGAGSFRKGARRDIGLRLAEHGGNAAVEQVGSYALRIVAVDQAQAGESLDAQNGAQLMGQLLGLNVEAGLFFHVDSRNHADAFLNRPMPCSSAVLRASRTRAGGLRARRASGPVRGG